MSDKPVTREEKYLAYLTGDYTGEIPKPITRKEKYLYELCLKGIGGEISPEEIKNAVNEYLEKNPVKPGATTEQAQQIEQNKKDIGSLKTETGSLKEDLTQLEEAINYVKVTDMLGSISGFGYSKNVTNPQWMNNEFSCESSGDGFCAIGSFDNYYLKSGRKYIVAYESSGQCILRGMNEYVYSDTISSNIGASFPLK